MEEMKKKEEKTYIAHILAVSYPSQGHINPMLEFCKRLISKNLKTTFAITNFIYNSMKPELNRTNIGIDTISDGFDEGGFTQAAGNIHLYLNRVEIAGRKSLRELIKRHQSSETPVDCIVYDAFLPWTVDVAKEFGLISASFFTQPCAVNYVYYCIYTGIFKSPITSFPVSVPGLPLLDRYDTPSFVAFEGSYPAYFELVLNQFLNAEKAEFMFVNTFYKLEEEVIDTMSKLYPILTIGPTLPSSYLDNRIENDSDYGLNLFLSEDNSTATSWLNSKPKGSVIYVSFGSMACLEEKQMQELAWGLKQTNYYFLWAIRSSSEEEKIPKQFLQDNILSEKGVLVRWSCQIEVLSSDSIGCFLSHCGWNSTMEALSLGVPMVVMPQWTDQTMNAKLVQDVWKIGIRVKYEDGEIGFVGRDEIAGCVKEVMEGEKGKEMQKNALKWKDLAKEAVIEGGTSDKCIDAFVSKFRQP